MLQDENQLTEQSAKDLIIYKREYTYTSNALYREAKFLD